MSGHVFVAWTDIRQLSCDAWLMPCDRGFRPKKSWFLDGEPRLRLVDSSVWSDSGRLARCDDWPEDRSRPWMCHVAGGKTRPVRWFVEGVREFVDYAAADLAGGVPRCGRSAPLLAVPVVGTQGGGAWARAGGIVTELVREALDSVERHDVDLVLVAFDGPMFAAVQAERLRQVRERHGPGWPGLDDRLLSAALALAERASLARLTVFLGAGASAGSGLPSWSSLLAALAAAAGLGPDEQSALSHLDVLDQARLIRRRLGDSRERLGQLVADQLAGRQHALTHALLADLPVREVVTTNYDTLFEQASVAAGQPVARLPWEPASNRERWVLKMHGCVTRPAEIVLSRDDYIQYGERRAALAGIVQTLLITRHMLFVGFSLDDPNFHRIAEAVRQALDGADDETREQFGTALSIQPDALREELWGTEIDWVCTAGPGDGAAAAARRLEVFLDALLAHTSNVTRHLLQDRYEAVLTPGQLQVRDAVLRFRGELDALGPEARSTSAWSHVRRLLERFE